MHVHISLLREKCAMLKKIFNIRNLIFILLIISFCFILVKQQSTLDEKYDAYRQAVAESERIENEKEQLDVKRSLSGTDTTGEELARDEGYIYDGEYYFIYD